jgi:hypothetical protein
MAQYGGRKSNEETRNRGISKKENNGENEEINGEAAKMKKE